MNLIWQRDYTNPTQKSNKLNTIDKPNEGCINFHIVKKDKPRFCITSLETWSICGQLSAAGAEPSVISGEATVDFTTQTARGEASEIFHLFFAAGNSTQRQRHEKRFFLIVPEIQDLQSSTFQFSVTEIQEID